MPTLRHISHYDKHHYNDMSDEIDTPPISQCSRESQQQKAHGHILKRSHLEEPTHPVKPSSTAMLITASVRGHHQVFSDERRRNCEETKVVAGMDTVPECTHSHCHGYPEYTITDIQLLLLFFE